MATVGRPFRKGEGGRPKGVPNKTTQLLKDAILRAAERAGNKVGDEGLVSYLEQQATENPGPFMSLLGKVLPMQVTGIDGGAVQAVVEIRRTIVDPVASKPEGQS